MACQAFSHACLRAGFFVEADDSPNDHGREIHVPNGIGGYADGVCDPAGGYAFTELARANFGKINVKRGHRVVEFVAPRRSGKPQTSPQPSQRK